MTDFISNVLLTDTSIIAFIVANLVVFVRIQSRVTELESDLLVARTHLALLTLDFQQIALTLGESGTQEQEGGSEDT